MITRSSNLATNLLIARVGPERVNATAHRLGADSIQVRRGVEDQKAYDRGLNNTTTARDLATLLAAIGDGRAASSTGTDQMLKLLLAQEFNDGIPAGLPPGTRVAHKTGEITGISHDAALVYPAGRKPYVLVILTKGYADRRDAMRLMMDVSKMIFEAVRSTR
jgi:beta-lactamase class A